MYVFYADDISVLHVVYCLLEVVPFHANVPPTAALRSCNKGKSQEWRCVCVCVCVCVWMCVKNGKLVYVLFFAIYYMYTAILHAGIIRKTLTARSIIHELLLVIVVNNSE
jgi:hypothetical protein